MPPTRGHDLKLLSVIVISTHFRRMPPTRGHDLKQYYAFPFYLPHVMPPTRGHDLKLNGLKEIFAKVDAPHTGARLETNRRDPFRPGTDDAPHTGARLETQGHCSPAPSGPDAPHTGARLETCISSMTFRENRMPPTRGHDLKHSRAYSAGGAP